MKYDHTKIMIKDKYALENLDSHTKNHLKIGSIVTAIPETTTNTYTLPEIEKLPDGWAPNFIENENHFTLVKIITNWENEL